APAGLAVTLRSGLVKRYAARLRCILGAALAGLVAATAANAQGGSLELSIKATYLVKFGSFIAWPDTAFAAGSSPLVLCVAGPDPFGAALDRAAAGQSIGPHPMEIRRIAAASPA